MTCGSGFLMLFRATARNPGLNEASPHSIEPRRPHESVPRGTIQHLLGALRLNQLVSPESRVSPNVPRETSCNQSDPLLDFRLAGVPWRESSRLPIKRVE